MIFATSTAVLSEKMDKNFKRYNEEIEKYAKGWSLKRISKISLAIMRCALCEILYMDDVPENEIYAMVERHIISPEFAAKTADSAIILSEDESIRIMIGEEDHLRIQRSIRNRYPITISMGVGAAETPHEAQKLATIEYIYR